MKRLIKYLICISAFILSSCSSEINPEDLINTDEPLKLSIQLTDKLTRMTNAETSIIEVNSSKYAEFLKWVEENEDGWSASMASYIYKFSISQKNFSLLYFPNGNVVIGFSDKEGNGHQYAKKIKPGELDFLFKK
jgi:hypothetical protein